MKKEKQYPDVNMLIEAIKMTQETKIKEYQEVGHIAVQSLRALEALKKFCPKGKLSSCPYKTTVSQ